MDDWAQADLAWKLADALSPALAPAERAQLYAVLGSGDSYTAITTVLRAALPLPAALIIELRMAARLRAQRRRAATARTAAHHPPAG
ncbi:hypothetical protein MAHJHV53_24540 [Mycobacterium avium subsp. hominissuis]|uniref:Uncharacterized protein n=1 Tax=Mycobacterium paraffinicum TaxID=53378 RepID=A0ABP8F352_9MYCO|nr:Zn-dependent oligopeptidase [Mycobacterium avium subsp. hominissuis TH135]